MCVLFVGQHADFPGNQQKEFCQIKPHYGATDGRYFLLSREVTGAEGPLKRLKKQSVYLLAERAALGFTTMRQKLLPKIVRVF